MDKREQARDKYTSNKRLAELALDSDAWVRWWVAQNPNAPVSALIRLAEDTDGGTRGWAIDHPNTPPLVKLWFKMSAS